MRKTVVVLTTRGKAGNQESTELIEYIIHKWECFQDWDAFPSFFIIPSRNRKTRPEVYMARYRIIKRNDPVMIV